MKIVLVVLISAITFAGCKHRKYVSHGLIKFQHSGIVNGYQRPLFVKTDKKSLSLTDGQIADLKYMIGNPSIILTEQDKQNYLKVKFNIVTTDTSTFLAIDQFILDNTKYYVDKAHKNDATKESYGIHINDSTYFLIYYEYKFRFFNDLSDYLQKHHCDKNVIQQLSYY